MKKVIFNAETISAIREFAATHTVKEICNRFTLTEDVARRVLRLNNIQFVRKGACQIVPIPVEIADDISFLFENTSTSLRDMARKHHLKYDRLIEFLKSKYSQEVFDKRKSRLYRESKLGDKNPMLGKFKELHPKYIGIVEDGKGYLMCLKPDWYTGRKGSHHIFVHSLVICEHLGLTEIPAGFAVHHIDGNKHNNDINNLALMTQSAHGRLHSILGRSRKVQRLGDNAVGRDPEMPDND